MFTFSIVFRYIVLYCILQKSPQSYNITPKGGNKPLSSNSAEDYGMDQNSDDSTDDESAPRKPIPSWAQGSYDDPMLYYDDLSNLPEPLSILLLCFVLFF